jgi:LysM repeat protein
MQHTRRLFLVLTIIATLAMTVGVFGSASAQALNGGCGFTVHTVVRGENLYRISLRYGVPMWKIQADNGISNPNLIYAGQTLCIIPGIVPPNQPQPQPQPGGTTYIVQPGDTLGRIARTYGVDMSVLARVNNIVNVNWIFAGQRLNIPDVTIQ